VGECCTDAFGGIDKASGQTEILLEEAPCSAQRVPGHNRRHRRHQPRQPDCVPTPQKRTMQRHRLPGVLSRAAPCPPPTGARSAAINATTSFAPMTAQHRGPGPSSQPCVRSGWRPTFHQTRHRRLITETTPAGPSPPAAATKAPSSAHRAAATGTGGTGYEAGGPDPQRSNGRPLTTVVPPKQPQPAKDHTQRQEPGIPLSPEAARWSGLQGP